MNSDDSENEKIVSSYNELLASLIENIQKISEESDSYYKVYFTFYCILASNLIDYNFLSIEMDVIFQFTGEHINDCITNSGITLMSKLAVTQKNLQLFHESFNAYIVESLEIYDKLAELPTSEETEIQHSLNLFSDNIIKISNLIKNVNASDFNEQTFELSEENKLVVLANILISSSLDNIYRESWNFMNESIDFFTALFENVPNLFEWTEFYFKEIGENDPFDYGQWSIPIIMVISNRHEIINQDYYTTIVTFLKGFIENVIEKSYNDHHSIIPTDDFLMISTLMTRLFELAVTEQFTIPPEDLNDFIKLSIQTQPTEEDCGIDDDYNVTAHEIGAIILRLASFILDQDKVEILRFLESISNDEKIVCQEMRYLIIFLIKNVLKEINDEQLQKLESLCLSGQELQVDAKYQKAYYTYIYYLFPDNHPIYKLYPIKGFVNDE